MQKIYCVLQRIFYGGGVNIQRRTAKIGVRRQYINGSKNTLCPLQSNNCLVILSSHFYCFASLQIRFMFNNLCMEGENVYSEISKTNISKTCCEWPYVLNFFSLRIGCYYNSSINVRNFISSFSNFGLSYVVFTSCWPCSNVQESNGLSAESSFCKLQQIFIAINDLLPAAGLANVPSTGYQDITF